MDLTAFGPYALNVRTNISSYGPRALLMRAILSVTFILNTVKIAQLGTIFQQISFKTLGSFSTGRNFPRGMIFSFVF